MYTWIWLGLAGAAGTVARYGCVLAVQRWLGNGFPWGTLAVNLLGCLLFGVVVELFHGKWLTEEVKVLLIVGFMGAFTTFSSFASDSMELYQKGQWVLAMANIVLQNLFGLVCLGCGNWIGKELVRWWG